jgi:hypothetical protein
VASDDQTIVPFVGTTPEGPFLPQSFIDATVSASNSQVLEASTPNANTCSADAGTLEKRQNSLFA